MNNSIIQNITHTFLFSLAFGTTLFSPVVDTKLTGVGFFKLGATIALSALVFLFGIRSFMLPELDQVSFFCFMALILSISTTLVLHQDRKSFLMWTLYVLNLFLFLLVGFLFYGATNSFLFFVSTSLFIGMANFSMILGHYYLVVPKLSEEPLIYCLYIFWTILFLRLINSFVSLISLGLPYLAEGTILGDGYVYNWLFILMRYLWGYLAPLILSFFVFRLCRLRSIQSATGVIYIVEFFVIVGELISGYLVTKYGLNL